MSNTIPLYIVNHNTCSHIDCMFLVLRRSSSMSASLCQLLDYTFGFDISDSKYKDIADYDFLSSTFERNYEDRLIGLTRDGHSYSNFVLKCFHQKII